MQENAKIIEKIFVISQKHLLKNAKTRKQIALKQHQATCNFSVTGKDIVINLHYVLG